MIQSGDPEAIDIAQTLCESVRKAYAEAEVTVVLFGSTVTISRGRPAVQIFVKGPKEFLVSIRQRHTFHMQQKPYNQNSLADVVRNTIGDPKTIESKPVLHNN